MDARHATALPADERAMLYGAIAVLAGYLVKTWADHAKERREESKRKDELIEKLLDERRDDSL